MTVDLFASEDDLPVLRQPVDEPAEFAADTSVSHGLLRLTGMSDDPATPIPVPDGWGEMTDDEKNKFVTDALVKIAEAPAAEPEPVEEAEPEAEPEPAAEPEVEAPVAEAEAEAPAVRVFREPGR